MTCQHPEGCLEPINSVGLCAYHYQSQRYEATRGASKPTKRTKKVHPVTKKRLTCTFDGCGRPRYSAGLCAGHTTQKNKGVELRPIRDREPCNILNCPGSTPYWTDSNLCNRHASQATKYGLTQAQLIEMWANPRCSNPACGAEDRLHIDHDHACCPGDKSCGKCVRGLLCQNCNYALGNVKDSVDKLKGLIEYLSR